MTSPLSVHVVGTVESTHPIVQRLLAIATDSGGMIDLAYHSRLASGAAAEPALMALAVTDLIIQLVALDDSLPHEFDWAGRALANAIRWQADSMPNLSAPRLVLLTGIHEPYGGPLLSWLKSNTQRPSTQRLLTRNESNLSQAERGPILFRDSTRFEEWASQLFDTLLFVATTSAQHDERTYLLSEQISLTPDLSHPSDQDLAFFADRPPVAAAPAPADVGSGAGVGFEFHAPTSVAPGGVLHIDLWAGFREHLASARTHAAANLPDSGPRLTYSLDIPRINATGLLASDHWRSEAVRVSWKIRVPPRAPLGGHQGRIAASVDGILVAWIHFKITVSKRGGAARAIAPQPVHIERPRTIEAIFAEEDRPAVEGLIRTAQRFHPDLTLAAETANTAPALHLIFWSRHAAAATSVETAWRTILSNHDRARVAIVPLENPPSTPLPKRLRSADLARGGWN